EHPVRVVRIDHDVADVGAAVADGGEAGVPLDPGGGVGRVGRGDEGPAVHGGSVDPGGVVGGDGQRGHPPARPQDRADGGPLPAPVRGSVNGAGTDHQRGRVAGRDREGVECGIGELQLGREGTGIDTRGGVVEGRAAVPRHRDYAEARWIQLGGRETVDDVRVGRIDQYPAELAARVQILPRLGAAVAEHLELILRDAVGHVRVVRVEFEAHEGDVGQVPPFVLPADVEGGGVDIPEDAAVGHLYHGTRDVERDRDVG